MFATSENKFLRKLAMPGVTGLVWALAAASIAFWVLRWPAQQAGAALVSVALTPSSPTSVPTHTQTAKALGHSQASQASAELPASHSFKLMGVIASPTGQGSALISTQSEPPKAYRAGQTVHEGWTLDSLTARQARLKSVNAQVTLDLPAADKP